MNDLLLKNAKWHWSKQCEEAFVKAKGLLSEAPILAHYDPSLPVHLAGDASAYGIGVVISFFPNRDERPIAYASRTLSNSEKIMHSWNVKPCHSFTGCRNFTNICMGAPLCCTLIISR